MTATLSRAESWTLLTFSAACLAVATNSNVGNGEPLMASLAFSGLAFSATFAMIRWAGPAFMKKGQKGRDMSKTNPKEIPEAMGAVAAAVYFLFLSCFVPFCFYKDDVTTPESRNGGALPSYATVTQGNDRFHRLPYYKVRPSRFSSVGTRETFADHHRSHRHTITPPLRPLRSQPSSVSLMTCSTFDGDTSS